MDKEDARKQSRETLFERRKQVIRLYKKRIGVMAIGEMTGLSYKAVRSAVDLYEAGGSAALMPRQRGRALGTHRELTAEQEADIQRLIVERRPEQLKMDFALWTRAAVVELIERECAVVLSKNAVGLYLKRWGFTPQRPVKRAYEQRPEAVKAWLDEQYPAIEKQAKAEGGEIHWGDETALINTDVRGRGFSPKGQSPIAMAVGGTREKFSMISTVSNQGTARWMIIKEAFNSDRLIEFMQLLIKDAGKKVFLILDNLRVHHSKPVKAWLAQNTAQIEVFYLPSYSPELNPDERLNADLKYAIGSKVAARSAKKLEAAATLHMTMVAANPERVKSYFQDPRVKYAA
jgi:transposase